MKQLLFCSLFIISGLAAHAQATQIEQNFNACVFGDDFPLDWYSYNPIDSTTTNGSWKCGPAFGRWGTAGVACTGVWSDHYHLDTSYLISPVLDLSGYTGGNIYVQFDTKTTNINLSGRLSLFVSTDSLFGSGDTPQDITSSLLPVFTNGDSSDWVTHEADLTAYETMGPVYLAFRYTSTTTSGSTWYIDNVFTTKFPEHVNAPVKPALQLTTIGTSTPDHITLSCPAAQGTYHITVFDMLGNKAHSEDINIHSATTTFTVNANLHSGMYLVRMENGHACSTTKTVVP